MARTRPVRTTARAALLLGGALFASSFTGAAAQHDMTSNLTALYGTWSSGSGAVLTGSGFANPVNFSFTYPATTGIAMSFTNDGYWEEAQYRFVSNGTQPNCVKAVIFWQHGSYTFQPNGSITMQPIEADGRIQVQDPCAAETSVLTYYYQPELYQSWQITNDIHHNTYMLQLQQFDGALFPRLYLVAQPPYMLPTVQLTTNQTQSDLSAVNQAAGVAQSVSKTGTGRVRRWEVDYGKRAQEKERVKRERYAGVLGQYRRWCDYWKVE